MLKPIVKYLNSIGEEISVNIFSSRAGVAYTVGFQRGFCPLAQTGWHHDSVTFVKPTKGNPGVVFNYDFVTFDLASPEKPLSIC